MKTAFRYLAIVALAIVALLWLPINVNSTENFTSTEEEEELGIDENPEYVAAREAFRRLQLQDENGQIPADALSNAYNEKAAMPFLPEAWRELLSGTELDVMESSEAENVSIPNPWVSIGPGNIGGRIRSIIISPTAPATMWVGGVAGGVWKTTNGGVSWSTNTDFLANLAVSCMAIDPANPNVLYAGTGEGFGNFDGIRGNGIFQTVNGGNSWTQMNSTKDNPDFYWVNRLAICPTNSQLLLAATAPGISSGKILRSVDGGETWVTRLTLQFATMTDVLFEPNTGTTDVPGTNCIAGTNGDGAYYSTDSGLTWTAAMWSPSRPSGRVELAYSRSDHSIVYASVQGAGQFDGQLYYSGNGGHTFIPTGSSPPGGTNANHYANSLWVDPTNPGTVIVGGQPSLWRTRNGGGSWEGIGSGSHADQHVIVADPGYNGVDNKIVYIGNDGGIYRTNDVLAGPVVWTNLNHNLGVTQFYGAAGHVASGIIIGGTQDNGTLRSPVPPSQDWIQKGGVAGGDGFFCAVDQTNNPYFYGEYYSLQIHRSTDMGFNASNIWNGPHGIPVCPFQTVPCANFEAPFVLDPNNENRILAGGRSLWRSNDARNLAALPSWTAIKDPITNNDNINAIAVAPGNSDVIWVGYNNGFVYYTTNGTAVTPTWIRVDNNGLPLNRLCTRITIGPASQAAVTKYVTFAGFNQGNVWKTENNGATWTDISGVPPNRVPSAPIYSLVVSPSNPNTLYIGTEVGVFASSDGGTTWSPSSGDPNVPVLELFWMGTKLVSVTHGRGIFTLGN
jgi:photosystem II stability/assembly factor-like uncharacterized protein